LPTRRWIATSEKHKPLKAQACKNCVYAVEVGGKDRKVLICTNKEGSGGELSVAETRGWCRNFQSRKKKAEANYPSFQGLIPIVYLKFETY